MAHPADAAIAASQDLATSNPLATGIQMRNVAFTRLSIAIVILLLQYMQPVLLPLVLSALLFYALGPAVDRLQSVRDQAVVARVEK